MQIIIGHFSFGIHSDKYSWRKYLYPQNFFKKPYEHHYYKYYYRWLIFFWCKPRKCELCGKYMTSKGGYNIWDKNRDEILITICDPCYKSSKLGWSIVPFVYYGDKKCLICKKAHEEKCQGKFKDDKCISFAHLLDNENMKG